ncbi:hypothetical protein HMPREF0731_0037, partial [Pseudoroseomonas cervicalis ATCC 49957]
RPDVPGELLTPAGDTEALLRASSPATPAERGVPALRSAITRSRQVEQLLPPATGKE